MSYICDLCGKCRTISRQQRHHRGVAGGKWKHRAPKTLKVIMPNLHAFNGIFNGVKSHWKFCTKCLRRVKAAQPKPRPKPKIEPKEIGAKVKKEKLPVIKPAPKISPVKKTAKKLTPVK